MKPRWPRSFRQSLPLGQSLPRERVRLVALLLAVMATILPSAFDGQRNQARASTVLAMDLTALTTASDHIVVGEVLSVTSSWEADRRRIITRVEINVAETWKGSAPASSRIVVLQPGGSVGDIEMKVHGLATFHEGDRAVLFLRGTGTAASVIGLGQGMRRLRYDSAVQRWMVMGGDRTAAVVRRADGALGPAAPESADTLAGLREKVRGLVKP